MVVIYLRHSNDNYSNPTAIHDQRAVPGKEHEITAVVKFLIETYGKPSVIICSPFKRARDTAEVITELFNGDVTFNIDTRVSRYFSSKEKQAPEVRKETMEFKPPVYESWSKFKLRVRSHVDEMVENTILKSRHTVALVITHALVLKEVCEYLQCPVGKDDYFEFLQFMCIRSHGPNYKPSFFSNGSGIKDLRVLQHDISREKDRQRRALTLKEKEVKKELPKKDEKVRGSLYH